jgi:sec-independent protein translocase protein TatB
MNPGIGLPELLVLMVLALVVVGPKDLPLMVRKVGQFVGKIRGMARDFQRSFDELGREAELAELRKEVEALKEANPINEVKREFQAAEMDALRDDDVADKPHPRVGAKSKASPKLKAGQLKPAEPSQDTGSERKSE